MAAGRPNLKIDVTADTNGIQKGMKESKAAVRDFESTSTGALNSVGNAFGVNVGAVNRLTSAVQGMGLKMQNSSNDAVKAIGKMVSGFSDLNAAVAGIGIGALVAGFKLLQSEAEAFKNTVQGAMVDMKTDAYIDTYTQAMHDNIENVGHGMADSMNSAKKGWKKTWADIKTTAAMTIRDMSKFPFKSSLVVASMNYAEVREHGKEAAKNAAKAEELAGRQYALQRQLSDKTVEWAEEEAKIAEYKRIAYDKSVPLLKQQEALAEAQRLIKERFGEEAKIRGDIADVVAEINSLSSSSVEAVDKENQLRVEAFRVSTAQDNALRELQEREASITLALKQQNKERAEELAKIREEEQARARIEAKHAELAKNGIVAVDSSFMPVKAEQENAPGIAIPVHIDASPAMVEFANLADLMTEGVEAMAVTFGELFGDLVNGEGAWTNFGQSALRSLGQIAMKVGKLAIGVGVAALGIKKALMLNPYAAIAAGAALVALGAAVSVAMGNIASSSGGYSAAASVASGGYGGMDDKAAGYGSQKMEISVTGTLKANGNQLVAVLNNENKRTNHTT